MQKIVKYIVSVIVTFGALNVATLPLNTASAGAGCQTLSSSTLNKKAGAYQNAIHKASKKYGVSSSLIKAVITVESCFRSKARGSLGEKGLMQLMPGTARRLKVKNGYNAWQNIHGGTRYLSYLLKRYNGNVQRAVAAYNAGEGRIKKSGRIPNKGYVRKVMQAYGKFSNGKERVFVASKAYRFSKGGAKKGNVKKASVKARRGHPAKQSAGLPWSDLSAAYKVKSGDTVYEVMRQTGVPVKKLIRLNKLSAPYKIKSGQVLKLR